MWPWRLKVRILLLTLMWLIQSNSQKIQFVLKSLHIIYTFSWQIYWKWNFFKTNLNYLSIYFQLYHTKYQNRIFMLNSDIQFNKFLNYWPKPQLHLPKKITMHKKYYFYLFLKTAIKPIKNIYKIHSSVKNFFLSYEKLTTTIYSMTYLYSKWKNFYFLLYHLLYYKIPILTFGTTLLQREILALNFQWKQLILRYWFLIRPYFFVKKHTIVDYRKQVFSILKLNQFNIALVLDINYHKHTLYFLKKFNFFTLGAVPLTNNLFVVDFALPINSLNIYSQLFFIRLFINIKKNILYNQFLLYKKLW